MPSLLKRLKDRAKEQETARTASGEMGPAAIKGYAGIRGGFSGMANSGFGAEFTKKYGEVAEREAHRANGLSKIRRLIFG